MIQPSKEIIDQIIFYNGKATELFTYLNGRINRNLCIAQIGGFSDKNFAEFMYPHRIAIFTGSIIESYFEPMADPVEGFNYIMSVIALVTAHELFHADQVPDVSRSSKDKDYTLNIEDSAEYSAEKWCYEHTQEFKSIFGFDYVFRHNKELFKRHPKLEVCETDRDYAIRSIMGLFRNTRVSEVFTECLDKYDTLYLFITDTINDHKWVFTVKWNGTVSFNRYEFSMGLSQFRYGISPHMYGMEIYTRRHKSENYGIFHIDIKQRDHQPIFMEQ